MLVNKSREVWRKCRLCLSSDVFLIFLFENSGALTNLAKTINELLQYEVHRGDKYPCFVCCKCSDKLWEFKEFKEKCHHSKKSLEAILSSGMKDANADITLLVKKEESSVKEEPMDFQAGKAAKWETSKDDTKKYLLLPEQLCVKEEEQLSECTMGNFEVFMESISADITEERSKLDNLKIDSEEKDFQDTRHGMELSDFQEAKCSAGQDSDSDKQVSQVENVTADKGQEEIGKEKLLTQESDSDMHSLRPDSDADAKTQEAIDMGKPNVQCTVADSGNIIQVTEHDAISVTQTPEADDTEETDIKLVLSDSECEILELKVVSPSKGEEAMHKKKPCDQLKVSILNPVIKSGAKRHEVKEKKHQFSVTDSESEVEILEHTSAAGAKGRKSICSEESQAQLMEADSDSDLEIIIDNNPNKNGQKSNCKGQAQPRVTEKKKFLRQNPMTSYFGRSATSTRRYERRERGLTTGHSSVECLDKSNVPSVIRVGGQLVNDKKITLILRPELDEINMGEISWLSNYNGRLRWTFGTIEKPNEDKMMLHLKESGEICVDDFGTSDGDCVNKSTNSVSGIGLRKTKKECPAVGERGKNQSGDRASDSEQSHDSESLTHLSQYKAIDEHECNRCGKQFQNFDKLRKHMTMDRTINCQYCSLIFKNDSELFEHLPSHDGKVKWSCGDCGEKSVRWKDVLRHIQVHRKAHKCKETISKPKSSQGIVCKVCHKRLPNKTSLRMHLLSHSEESKWVCPHCQDDFTEQGSLLRHIVTHNTSSNGHSIE